MRKLNAIDWIAMVLLIIGGLNWGSVGLFRVDLVASVFGWMTPLSRAVYMLVGLAALYDIFALSAYASRRAEHMAQEREHEATMRHH
jgi:uncharacterized membrane protein YuzA (DUF378 family)